MNNNPWMIQQDAFSAPDTQLFETLFALGNGYIGVRATQDEGVADSVATTPGTYLNGFFERKQIHYGERFFGYPTEGQTMVPVIDSGVFRPKINNTTLALGDSTIRDYSRSLDLQTGVLTRRLVWLLDDGQQIEVTSQRMVLHAHRHISAIRYALRALETACDGTLMTELSNRPKAAVASDDPRLGHGLADQPLKTMSVGSAHGTQLLMAQTRQSAFDVMAMARLVVNRPVDMQSAHEADNVTTSIAFSLAASEVLTVDKFVCYATSLDVNSAELPAFCAAQLAHVTTCGWDQLSAEQARYMADFWKNSTVTIKGDMRAQRGLRFNMFHLLQSTGRDAKTNIAAKGLTGEGYEGHTFWDTEIYVLPFFLYTKPEIARALLTYRYNTLPQARLRARQMAHTKGALFPWRTIDGDEVSAYFPGGTAQYHINADIAYAVQQYWDATRDAQFMLEAGVALLIETARLWADVGHYDAAGKFHISCVTGPDEYTALVDDNAYTNMMAAENMRFAAEMVKWASRHDEVAFRRLSAETALNMTEVADWQAAALAMFLVVNSDSGVIGQDAAFFSRPVFDLPNTPAQNFPLLLHYHPLVLYRSQVCKQADLLLAHYLLPTAHSPAQKARDFRYYEPLTTHDSSLSNCIFGILAAELGDHTKAYGYFGDSAVTDLENKKGNTKDGIHAANMAGSWLSIVAGFAGMRTRRYEGISFDPIIPDGWERYQFRIVYRGTPFEITVTQEQVCVQNLSGNLMQVFLYGEAIAVLDAPVTRSLRKPRNMLGAH